MTTRAKSRAGSELCADCGAQGPAWASVNRGVLICDECCSVHRSLGRHISQIRHLKHGLWAPSLLSMVKTLVSNGANLIWEHSLHDPSQNKNGIRKPIPTDPVHPTKSNFIKAKYQMLAFVLRLPCKDDDTSSTSDFSQQLHSSVRTGNLETSLRLLTLGAQPNYLHPERGNMPLHVAANAGQAAQVELLVGHGADPAAVDVHGKTPVDHAFEAGHKDVGYRLIELQYELTDRLTYYLCGRKPDHRNGQHYLIPSMQERYADLNNQSLDVSEHAQKARLKLQALSNHLFEELASDVYDEVDRRECDAIWLATQNHSALVSDPTTVPFLPVNPSFSATRNQGRQKLALFNAQEFSTLILDLLADAKNREQGFDGEMGPAENWKIHSFQELPPHIEEDRLSHDYDEVASDEEPDNMEAAEQVNRQNLINSQVSGTVRTEGKSSSKEASQETLTADQTSELKRQLGRAEAQIQALKNSNASLSQEISLLQTMVQRLMDENSELRAQIPLVNGHDSVFPEPTNPQPMYENTQVSQFGPPVEPWRKHLQDMPIPAQEDNYQQESEKEVADNDADDDDHVPIDDITPYARPGSLLVQTGVIPSQDNSKSSEEKDGKKTNPYDNIRKKPSKDKQFQEAPTMYLHVDQQAPLVQHEPEIIDNSDVFQPSPLPPQPRMQGQFSYDRLSSEERLDEQRLINNEAQRILSRADEMIMEVSQPTQEDVVRCTEQITKKIQELLLSAQAGKHHSFIPCSGNITSAVQNMASLFPDNPTDDTIKVSLQLMLSSAHRLHLECKGTMLPDHSMDMAFVTQQVIQCAYDIAKAAKQLVTHFSSE